MEYLSILAYLASRAKSHPELQDEVDALREIIRGGFNDFLRGCAPEILP
jgi:hypothetical protein